MTRLFFNLVKKMLHGEPVPELLAELIHLFESTPDPLDSYCRAQTNAGAESVFLLALTHGVDEAMLRRVASGPPRPKTGRGSDMTPYFSLGRELASIWTRQMGGSANQEVGDVDS